MIAGIPSPAAMPELAGLVDLVIAFTVFECAALLAYRFLTGGGIAPRGFLLNMVSGLCLMAALRCVLRDAGESWVAFCLLAAGIAHGADLLLRWRAESRALNKDRRVTGMTRHDESGPRGMKEARS